MGPWLLPALHTPCYPTFSAGWGFWLPATHGCMLALQEENADRWGLLVCCIPTPARGLSPPACAKSNVFILYTHPSAKQGLFQITSRACSCVRGSGRKSLSPAWHFPCPPHPSPVLQPDKPHFVQGSVLYRLGQAPAAKAGSTAGKTLIVRGLTQESGTTKGLWGSSGGVGF